MKKKLCVLISIAIFICSLFSVLTVSNGYYVPENVRIGLYFTGNKGGRAATASIKVASDIPMKLESYFNGVYTNMGITYIALDVKKLSDTYHLGLGEMYPTCEQAVAYMHELANKGIHSYLAYFEGKWGAWAGEFPDILGAIEYMEANLSGDNYVDCTLEYASSARMGCYSGGELVFVHDMPGARMVFTPTEEGHFVTLNDNIKEVYRGSIEILRHSSSDMTVINSLSTEEYLYGVVPAEIETDSPEEAIKAQAVAARTYVANNLNKYASYGFDMCATVYDQVYSGVYGEHVRATQAVNATAGKILLYDGRPTEVFYFSSAGGGFTEASENVWGSSVSYLKSVDSTFESGNSWKFKWEVKMSANGISNTLKSAGYDIGTLTDIRVRTYTEAGRVAEIEFIGTAGTHISKRLSARTILDLYSQMFVIEKGNGDGTAALIYPISTDGSSEWDAIKALEDLTPTPVPTDEPEPVKDDLTDKIVKPKKNTVTFGGVSAIISGIQSDGDSDGISLVIPPGTAPLQNNADSEGTASSDGSLQTGENTSGGNTSGDGDGLDNGTENNAADGASSDADTFIIKTELPYTGGIGVKLIASDLASGVYRFIGRGWGHAVGLSQEGAKGLANNGYDYVRILQHYFPGSTVE